MLGGCQTYNSEGHQQNRYVVPTGNSRLECGLIQGTQTPPKVNTKTKQKEGWEEDGGVWGGGGGREGGGVHPGMALI